MLNLRYGTFSVSLSIMGLILLGSLDVLAQNYPSIPVVQSTESQSTSPVSFDTRDTISTFDSYKDYKPMPLPAVREGEESGRDHTDGGQLIRYDINSQQVRKLEIEQVPDLPSSKIKSGHPGIYPFDDEFDKNEDQGAVNDDPNQIQKFSSLQQVSDPSTNPYRMNVKMFMTYPSGDSFVCSGSLVDYEWVLTAAHCMYDDDEGGWASEITVVPGFENGNEPFGNAKADQLFALSGWTDDEDYDDDIGWIRLRRPVGFLTGWFSFGYDNDDSFFKNSTFHNPGYPAESPYDGDFMYKWSGSYDFKVFKIETYQVGQDRVGFGGQSGSGAYAFKNSKRVQYAVLSHTLEDNNDNRKPPTDYTRITSHRFNLLENRIASERHTTLDLAALNVKALPADPVEGTPLESLKFYVANRTSAEQGGTWSFDIYLSDNPDISTADELLSTQSFTHTFLPGQLLHVNASPPTIPLGHDGKQYVGVILKQSDFRTSNNDSDGWDAAELDITSARKVTLESENPGSGVDIRVEPLDIYDREDGTTPFVRRFEDGTPIVLSAPPTKGTNKFSGWYNEYGIERSSEPDYSTYARYGDQTLTARYVTPDIPVLPHAMGEIMPSYHADTYTQELKIINNRSTTFDWNISSLHSSSWLSVSDTSGATPANSTTVVDVIFDSSNLDTGEFTDTLEIDATYGAASSSFVPIRLRVGHMPGTIPTPEEFFQAHEPFPGGLFGRSIGFDLLGGLISFGMPGLNERSGGLVMYDVLEGGELGEGSLITPGETVAESRFGQSQSLFTAGEVGLMAVGAPAAPDQFSKFKTREQTSHIGQVHLFRQNDGEWVQDRIFQPDVSGEEVRFGAEVAGAPVPDSDGEYILAVGAPGLDHETAEGVGAVFVYRIQKGEVLQQSIVWPSQIRAGGGFGSSIGLKIDHGQTLLAIGAPGDAAKEIAGAFEVHNFTGETWQLWQRTEADEKKVVALFGASVSMSWHDDQPLIAVGAPAYGEVGGIFLYHYTPERESWVEKGSILEGPKVEGAGLGRPVELVRLPRSTMLMAGAPGMNAEDYGGSAWLFQLNEGADKWNLRSRLEPREAGNNDGMGTALAPLLIDEKIHYVSSAPGTEIDGASAAGAAYRFNLSDPASLPRMNLSTLEITESIQKGDQLQVALPIQSTGEAELLWSLTGLPAWIQTESTEGAVPAGGEQAIPLTLIASHLEKGQYNTSLVLTSNDLNRDTTLIPVQLTVRERLDIDLVVIEATIVRGDTLESGELLGEGSGAWVTNNGADVIDTTLSLGLFLSPDSLVNSEDSLIASVRIDTSLQVEQQLRVDFPIAARIPDGYPVGRAYLGVQIDHDGTVAETDTTNNSLELPLWIIEASSPQLLMAVQYRQLQVELETEPKSIPVIVENQGVSPLEFSVPGFGNVSAAKNERKEYKITAEADSIPAYLVDVQPAAGEIAPGDSVELLLTMDGSTVNNGTYQDTLSLITNDPSNGSVEISMQVSVGSGTSVKKASDLPRVYSMDPNYPNPFNPSTTISFALPENAPVRLEVFNLLGRKVATLVQKSLSAGRYNVEFNAKGWSSGVYIYRLRAGSFTETRKMLLLK